MDKSATKEGVELRDYEIALLLPQEELLPQILKLLSQHNIEIKSEGSVKKIRLAYDINHAKEAYFVFFHVSALPDNIKSLEANLMNNAQILRFLIVRLPGTKAQRDEASKRVGRPFRRPAPAGSGSPSPESRPPQPASLSNEALEKKIEEISK